MSDTGSPAAPAPEPVASAPAPAAPEPVVTEVDIPPDGGFPAPDPEPAPSPAPAAADAPPAEPEPKTIKKSPYQARIDALTAQREAERREKEDLKRQVELYKAMAEGNPPADPVNPTPAAPPVGLVPGSPEFQKAVRDEAARIAAEETAKARTTGLLAAGNTEYKDFTDRCNVVASLGAGDRTDFMQIVTDPAVITDGHKVIAELAERPDEAARILALPTVQMTAALVKFQSEISKAPPPKPLSSAPAPIKPIDGVTRGSDEPSESDSMAEYARKYRAQQEKKLRESRPSRFARH